MRTAIFDLDGTLVDTAVDLMIAGNRTFEELGWKIRLKPEFSDGIAIGGGRSMIRYGFSSEGISYTEEDVTRIYPKLLGHYDKTLDKNSFLYDGIKNVLKRLKSEGWALGVCTNKPELQANTLLTKLEIRSYFDSFVGSDTIGVAKPRPEPLYAAIDRAGGEKSLSVLIGDTKTDRDTAKAAKVKSVLVNYGHGALTQDLRILNSDGLVNNAEEIPEMLEKVLKAE